MEKVLSELNFLPKQIIVIDDKEKNLKSFYAETKKISNEIKFMALRYNGVLFLPKPNIDEYEFKKILLLLTEKTKTIYNP